MLNNDHDTVADMSPLACQTPSLEAGPKKSQYNVEELPQVIVHPGDGFHCESSDYNPMVNGAAAASRSSWPIRHVYHKSWSTSSGYQCSEKMHHKMKAAWKRYRARVRPQIWHSRLYVHMQEKSRRRDRCAAMGHASYRTVDLGAFSDVDSRKTASKALPEEKQPEKDAIPAWLAEGHQRVDSAKILAQYMATSEYIVSLAGPPLPDMRYGVIIVPCGEEELLLRRSDLEVSYDGVQPSFTFAHQENGIAYEKKSHSSVLGGLSSMASTEFRYYDRQRLLEEWQDDRRAVPWMRPNHGSDWSNTKNDSQDLWREENSKLGDPAQRSQWSATHVPDYGSWVEQEMQSFDQDGRQAASARTRSNGTDEPARRESSKSARDLNVAGSPSDTQARGSSAVSQWPSRHVSRAADSTANVSNRNTASSNSEALKLVTDASANSHPTPATATHDGPEQPLNVPVSPSCLQPSHVEERLPTERPPESAKKGKKRCRRIFRGLFNALLRRKPALPARSSHAAG